MQTFMIYIGYLFFCWNLPGNGIDKCFPHTIAGARDETVFLESIFSFPFSLIALAMVLRMLFINFVFI